MLEKDLDPPCKKDNSKEEKNHFRHVKSRRSSTSITSIYFWVLTIVGELSSLNPFQSGHGASFDIDRIFKKKLAKIHNKNSFTGPDSSDENRLLTLLSHQTWNQGEAVS